jgi:hypothetical protein
MSSEKTNINSDSPLLFFKRIIAESTKTKLFDSVDQSLKLYTRHSDYFNHLSAISLDEIYYEMTETIDIRALAIFQYCLFFRAIEPLTSKTSSSNPLKKKIHLSRFIQSLHWYFQFRLNNYPTRRATHRDLTTEFTQKIYDQIDLIAAHLCWQSVCLKLKQAHTKFILGLAPLQSSFLNYILNVSTQESLEDFTSVLYSSFTLVNSLNISKNIQPDDNQLANLLSCLPQLKILNIYESAKLQEKTAQAIEKLFFLKFLKIQSCPQLLSHLNHLPSSSIESLALQNMNLEGKLSGLSSYPHLHSLDLSGSSFDECSILQLQEIPSLKHLSLNYCPYSSAIALHLFFQTMPSIKSLSLLALDSLHASSVQEFPLTLESINFSWCSQLRDEAIKALDRLPHLSSLNLAHCRRLSLEALRPVASLSKLKKLSLDFCLGLNLSLLEVFLSSLSLTHLSLRGLDFWPTDWQTVLKPSLHSLSLGRSFDQVAFAQAEIPNLRSFSIQDCQTLNSQDFKIILSKSLKLKNLSLENAGGFTADNMHQLSSLTDLKSLRLWGSSSYPQQISSGFELLANLPCLEHLELAFNGQFDAKSLYRLLLNCKKLKSVELGPMSTLIGSELEQLRENLPWLRITCYGYLGVKAF